MTCSIKTSPVPPPKSTTHMNMYTLTINMLYSVGEKERKREGKRVTWQMRKERRLVFNPDQWLVEYIHFYVHVSKSHNTKHRYCVHTRAKNMTTYHHWQTVEYKMFQFDGLRVRMFLAVWLSSESRVKDRRDQNEKLYLYTAVQIREDPFAHSNWGQAFVLQDDKRR